MKQRPQNPLAADAASASTAARADLVVMAIGLAGALAVILGAKLWLIASYGSSTPFWDQWEEPGQIFRPYLTGELTWHGLLAAHNEHRILLTRLVALAVFIAQGRWDPIALTLLNAVIHVAAIGLMVAMLARTLDVPRALLLAVFAAILFAPPFGWGNTLVGFQTQFYLLVLLGPATLWVLYASTAWSPRWWLGTLLGILSYFTIASGALALPAFVALAAIQRARGERRGRAELLGLAAHLAIAAILLLDIPRVPAPEEGIPVHSLSDWYEAVATVASWPVAKPSWSMVLRALTAIGLSLPAIVLALRLLRQRAPLRDPGWLVIALAGWTVLQMLAFIYGRGQTVLQSRYFDVLLIAPLANAAALMHLQREGAFARWRISTVFACIWFAALVIGLGQKAFDDIPPDLAWRRDTAAAQTENLKRYLATGDFAALADKPRFQIPYPSAERLRDTISDPIIRMILPPDLLNHPEPPQKLKGVALRQGHLLLPIGLALLLVAALLALADLSRAGSK